MTLLPLPAKELQDDATITTRANGRSWQSEATKVYDVISETPPTASNIDAVMANWPRAIGVAHPVFSSLFLIEIAARMNDHRVRVVETYGVSDQTATENQYGEIWEWDLAAQTTHIAAVTDPAKQVHYPTAYNTGAAIGVDGDSVNGVDVYRPGMSLKVSKHFTGGNLYAELQTIQALLNKTNSGAWKYYKAGEVLFIGAPVRKIKSEDWLVEYNFLIARQSEPETITLATGMQDAPALASLVVLISNSIQVDLSATATATDANGLYVLASIPSGVTVTLLDTVVVTPTGVSSASIPDGTRISVPGGTQIQRQNGDPVNLPGDTTFTIEGSATVTIPDGTEGVGANGEALTFPLSSETPESPTVTITRRPWDYVWYRYLSNTVDSGDGNMILSRGIESVHIAQVYEEGEFGNLNLMGPV